MARRDGREEGEGETEAGREGGGASLSAASIREWPNETNGWFARGAGGKQGRKEGMHRECESRSRNLSSSEFSVPSATTGIG